MVITVDGPAGAGKSSAARGLARRLDFLFLDTGAMYRAIALAGLRRQIAWDDSDAVAALAADLHLEWDGSRMRLDGEDVSEEIRAPRVTECIHHVADNSRVRTHLVDLQRDFAEGRDIVTEGRDQGTVAFPDSACKIFLTASDAERAERRMHEFQERGEVVELDELKRQIRERDDRDQQRSVGRLRKADDAIEVVTDSMSLEEVVDRLEEIVRAKGYSEDR